MKNGSSIIVVTFVCKFHTLYITIKDVIYLRMNI